MQILSIYFLIFLAIVAAVNYVLPQKIRPYWLLIANMAFYASYKIAGLLVIIAGIIISYTAGRLIQRSPDNKKTILAGTILALVGSLCYFKYTVLLGATIRNIQELVRGSSDFRLESILIPLGISYFLLQMIGYVVDVYKGEVDANCSIVNYALFVSFFPTVVSGPIERAGNMIPQYENLPGFDEDNIRKGILQIIWGFFLKMIVADRLGVIVSTVNADPAAYKGTVVFIAVLMYALQIYTDFGGYSSIAIGSARVLGIKVMDNFNSPFLSTSVAELWRRWHISLSTWFRDYVYIPLGGNRKGTARKYLNLLITFFVSGLWHGAAWTYAVWGLINGIFQVIGMILMPARNKIVEVLHIDREAFSHRLLKTVFTFLLFSFAVIFFGKDTFAQAVLIIKNMWQFTPWVLTDGSLYTLGLDRPAFNLMLLGLMLMVIADIAKYRGVSIPEVISRQSLWIRWCIYIGALVLITVCGVWGHGYDATSFIYVQF
ncbi:MBOAT family O-acyltransferase [Butyrivibrio fibrisolvens]|uniref:MBOAT family O-acyltransferase n=1 Tax=Butyrivibrio fibrisolvens TaxID=831 RepID=UPI000425A751|nr:MBOAT family O-acyltransferase [Butyrivibrio fibrisolvens]